MTGLLFVLGAAAAGCGPPTVRPVSYPDSAVPCPAGLVSWNLEVLDQRARPDDGDKMRERIRDGVEKSFPGCRWSNAAAGTPTITITVHRFGVEENDRYQDAAAEWTVTASSAGGSTVTEFDAEEQDTRPAYSGADAEALNEAFRKALQKTVRGLAAIQRIGSMRPPSVTLLAAAGGSGRPASRRVSE